MFSDITSWDREGEEKREVGREGGKNSTSKIELKSNYLKTIVKGVFKCRILFT